MVLATLLDARDEWSHGYQLAQLADVKSGTLYPLLIRLEAQGYLAAVGLGDPIRSRRDTG
jgi:PadR family transcriptional regulator PadR